MTNTTKSTKAEALALVQALSLGLQKHYPNGQLTVGNVPYAVKDLVTLLDSLASAMIAERTAATNATDALTALRTLQAKLAPVIQDLKDLLLATYGNATQTLSDFGLAPHKARTPLTVEQKAAAKAKRDATRAARGTKGPKAKLAITGDTATQQATPAAAPATPPAAPAATPTKPAT